MATDEINDETPISELRKLYEKQRDLLKAANTELDTLRSEKRQTSVSAILKAKGAPEKAAKFYTGEADEASVSAWLEENKDLFPVSTPGAESTTTQTVTDPNAEAAARMAAATAGTGSGSSTDSGGAIQVDPTEALRLMKSTPRTPEGYQRLVEAGIFPPNPNAV